MVYLAKGTSSLSPTRPHQLKNATVMLEIERRVPRAVYFELMQEAKEAALPVGGKVRMKVTPIEASDAGQATIDNLETIYDGVFGAGHEHDLITGIDTFLKPGGGGTALFATLARNGTAVTGSSSPAGSQTCCSLMPIPCGTHALCIASLL